MPEAAGTHNPTTQKQQQCRTFSDSKTSFILLIIVLVLLVLLLFFKYFLSFKIKENQILEGKKTLKNVRPFRTK